jgi:hypothetical protein
VIEELADGLQGKRGVAAEIPLRKHSVQMGLCGPQSAINDLADVLASPGLRVAPDLDADQPCAGSAANDLTNLTYHFCLLRRKCGTRVAHVAAA